MAETKSAPARADIDIQEDIHRLMQHYGPLINDRHRIEATVADGAVTVTGYVKNQTTANYFLNNTGRIRGVSGVDASQFFADDTMRIAVGHVIPPGISVTLEYGAVILSGVLPPDADLESIVGEVVKVPGVNRVLTSFPVDSGSE